MKKAYPRGKEILIELVHDGMFTEEVAAECMGKSIEEFKRLL